MSSQRNTSERGTVAVVVALSATMLFALCALGVDLGSGFARKRDIQTQADLAALAAAAELPYTGNAATIAAAAKTYALQNEVMGQVDATWNFIDADMTNGFIEFVGSDKLRLYAPHSEVDFWLAPVAGLPSEMKVSAIAAAQIETPGKGLPFFLSSTCGWGQQTILDQTKGPEIPPGYEPTLTPTTDPPASVVLADIDPDNIEVDVDGDTTTVLTITATTNNGMNNVNLVGFTTEDGAHETVAPLSNSGQTVTVEVPASVDGAEAVWWVRVRKGSQNRWSASADAKPFVVGDPSGEVPPGSCDSKNSGNFGSLDLSRDDVNNSRYLVENMALGIQHDLDVYPAPAPTPPDGCADEDEAEIDTGQPVEGQRVNCLVTDTGSDLAQKATEAFITGTAQGSPARLDGVEHETAIGCDPSGSSDERILEEIPGDPAINNDVLSCFITGGHSVGDVTKEHGAPAHVISEDIFYSPRLFYVPVLVADPSGGAGSYAILDMRPVFITAQPDSATKGDPQASLNPGNGIEMSNNGKQIEKIRVRAINPISLPEFAPSDVAGSIPYIGSGSKVVRLVE